MCLKSKKKNVAKKNVSLDKLLTKSIRVIKYRFPPEKPRNPKKIPDCYKAASLPKPWKVGPVCPGLARPRRRQPLCDIGGGHSTPLYDPSKRHPNMNYCGYLPISNPDQIPTSTKK